MNSLPLPRLLIGAVSSGAGKTAATCGIMRALSNRGLKTSAFKCGPDFIDPMFHSQATGGKSRNLDLFFTGEETVKALLGKHARGADIVLMEGVMGYYDGLGGKTEGSGSYHLARATGTPALLVINPRGMSLSLGALVKGFAGFREDSGIKGVILNCCSPSLYPLLREIIEGEAGIKALGFLPEIRVASLESRHLGLVTAGEVEGLQEKLDLLAQQCEKTIDLEGLLEIAATAPPLQAPPLPVPDAIPGRPRIAVARDEAFCFHYEDNYDLLRETGAKIVPFSPLHDKRLPPGTAGIFLGGGYPEVYAPALSANSTMLESVAGAINDGMPAIAECGGFLYLHDTLEDLNGRGHRMAGVIKGRGEKSQQMGNFGYVTLTAREDNLLCRAGESINAHEFHYWQSETQGNGFEARKPVSGKTWPCVHTGKNLYAGFPHVYFYGNPSFGVNFAAACALYGANKNA